MAIDAVTLTPIIPIGWQPSIGAAEDTQHGTEGHEGLRNRISGSLRGRGLKGRFSKT
jgi:hypothetical protein